VLLVSEARGFVHDSIPDAVAYFDGLGRRSRRYSVIHLRGAAELTPARLKHASAVVFALTSGELPLPDRPALLRFVRDGGAFVGVHSASDTFHGWPGYARMLGAEFRRHARPHEGSLVVLDRRHPATRRLPRAFRLFEEFYEFKARPLPGTHVLVRLGSSRPLVWSRRYGKGRVFYDALGHFGATWRNRLHARLVSGGLAWALRLAG
jgi:uncharacterized protein